MNQSKPKQGPSGPRCTETVPRALYGPVGMLPRCTLTDGPHGEPHRGDHRATYAIGGVGKVLFKWRIKMKPLKLAVPLKGWRTDKLIVDDPSAGWPPQDT